MLKSGKLQAVIIVMIMAAVAGCAATKEYTSKLFKPAVPESTDTQSVALKFLELDELSGNDENWVSTDIITGRDSTNEMIAIETIDKLAEKKPAVPDSTLLTPPVSKPVDKGVVVRQTTNGEVREKRVRE